MNNEVIDILKSVIQLHGISVIADARRCRTLLLHHCAGEYGHEVNLLIVALEEGVAANLNHPPIGFTNPKLLIAHLIEKMMTQKQMDRTTADWVVRAWSDALSGNDTVKKKSNKNSSKRVLYMMLVLIIMIFILIYSILNRESSKAEVPYKYHKVMKKNIKDGASMMYIPAGEFIMGSKDTDETASDDEIPQHKVKMDGFYIYMTEVTVAQYRIFCQETGRIMPHAPSWGWVDTHPMVNVTWDDAKAYSIWADAALPTEAQWEKAIRGVDGRYYPWGNEWDARKCNNVTNANGKTSPSGSFLAGASPYGVMDMAGNVREWCADWYSADYYNTVPVNNPTGPPTGVKRVLRGGSWFSSDPGDFRTASRFFGPPTFKLEFVGFRCAVWSSEP
jgi:sulfatase modifying factor 1